MIEYFQEAQQLASDLLLSGRARMGSGGVMGATFLSEQPNAAAPITPSRIRIVQRPITAISGRFSLPASPPDVEF